jgi:tripartite-type tricarboxylate transporter receptor subunit TctC
MTFALDSLRRGIARTLLMAVVALTPAPSGAADYPTKRVTLMVGFAAGGAVDTAARLIAQELSASWNQTVVVENRPGAESNLATRTVAQAAPDGYTLLLASTGIVINQSLYKKLDYTIEQLSPIGFPALGDGIAIAVAAKNPALNLTEFLESMKSRSFTLGAGGAFARIAGEYLFKVMAKAETIHVPFPGGAPALSALVGNHIEVLSAPIPEVLPQVQQGTVRVLAVTGAKRSASLPDVPTLGELGFQGLEVGGMTALFAPSGTPSEICDQLNEAVNQAMAKPAVRERLRSLGYEANPMSRQAAVDFLKRQLDTWGKMVRATGITVE